MLAGEVVTSLCNEVKVCSGELTYRLLPQGAHERPKSVQRGITHERQKSVRNYWDMIVTLLRLCLVRGK